MKVESEIYMKLDAVAGEYETLGLNVQPQEGFCWTTNALVWNEPEPILQSKSVITVVKVSEVTLQVNMTLNVQPGLIGEPSIGVTTKFMVAVVPERLKFVEAASTLI